MPSGIDDPLVVDKWLILQAGCTLPGTLERVRTLTTHPAFTYKNPNKVRSLIATFCATNHCQFHADDGSAYAFPRGSGSPPRLPQSPDRLPDDNPADPVAAI
jgi:aminopeptidase N